MRKNSVRYDWGLVVMGLCALQASATAQAATTFPVLPFPACTSAPLALVYPASLSGFTMRSGQLTSYTGVAIRAKNSNNQLIPVCNATVTLKDSQNNTYTCKTSNTSQSCAVVSQRPNTLATTVLRVVEVLHAGVKHVVSKCQIQANRPSAGWWFPIAQHTNLDCPPPTLAPPVAPPNVEPPVSAPDVVSPI